MRLDPLQIGGAADLYGTFNSSQPSFDALKYAYADPMKSALLDPNHPEWAQDMLNDSRKLMRDIVGRSSVQVGVPVTLVPPIMSIIQDPADTEVWLEAMKQGIDLGIDIAMEAIGAVPIVGAIVKVAYSLVFVVIDAATDDGKDDLPSQRLSAYSKPDNDDAANDILSHVGTPDDATPDWTPIFRPPVSNPTWVRKKVNHSHIGDYVFMPEPGSDGEYTYGLGYIPGKMQGLAQINFEGHHGYSVKYKPFYGGWDRYFHGVKDHTDNGQFQELWQIAQNTYDVSEVRPSAVQAAAITWQMVGSRTAAMFNVDVRGVADEWTEYVDNAMDVLNDYQNSDAESTHIEQDDLDRLFSFIVRTKFYDIEKPQFYTDSYVKTLKGKPTNRAWELPTSRRVDVLVRNQMNALKARQLKAMGTLMVAYCSDRQTAFRNEDGTLSGLGQLLMRRREMFLRSKWVRQVKLEDVIDPHYREDVKRAQRQNGFHLSLAPGDDGNTDPDQLSPEELKELMKSVRAIKFQPLTGIPKPDPWGGLEKVGDGAVLKVTFWSLLTLSAIGGAYSMLKKR